jgi:hypothetical protein
MYSIFKRTLHPRHVFPVFALCLDSTYEWIIAQEHPISNHVSPKNERENKIAPGSK